jgi:hypothetical protein
MQLFSRDEWKAETPSSIHLAHLWLDSKNTQSRRPDPEIRLLLQAIAKVGLPAWGKPHGAWWARARGATAGPRSVSAIDHLRWRLEACRFDILDMGFLETDVCCLL